MGESMGVVNFDERTKKWMDEHPWTETTVARCIRCGEYYKPNIGHSCRQLKNEHSGKITAGVVIGVICPGQIIKKEGTKLRVMKFEDWDTLKAKAEYLAYLGFKVSVNGWEDIRNNILTVEGDE